MQKERRVYSICCDACGHRFLERQEGPVDQALIERFMPCRECGASTPNLELTVVDSATARESMTLKGRAPGMTRPVVEAKAGADFHRDSGEWRHLVRRIDRSLQEHDEPWYDETITDQSGRVIRRVSEPLRNHKGRGSARKNRR
jgi:hypothetical protein